MNAAAKQKQDIIATFPIIVRKLEDGTKVVFLVNTVNLDKNEIEMWAADSDTPLTHTVKMDVYRNSLGVESAEETDTVRRFSEMHKIAYGLVLRKRLFKDSKHHVSHPDHVTKSANDTLRRAADKPSFDKDLYMQTLTAALQVAIKAAMDGVNDKFK